MNVGKAETLVDGSTILKLYVGPEEVEEMRKAYELLMNREPSDTLIRADIAQALLLVRKVLDETAYARPTKKPCTVGSLPRGAFFKYTDEGRTYTGMVMQKTVRSIYIQSSQPEVAYLSPTFIVTPEE